MTDLDPNALAACPFCGESDRVKLIGTVAVNVYRVRCERCDVTSGCEVGEAKTIAAWNRRALPAPGEVVAKPLEWVQDGEGHWKAVKERDDAHARNVARAGAMVGQAFNEIVEEIEREKAVLQAEVDRLSAFAQNVVDWWEDVRSGKSSRCEERFGWTGAEDSHGYMLATAAARSLLPTSNEGEPTT